MYSGRTSYPSPASREGWGACFRVLNERTSPSATLSPCHQPASTKGGVFPSIAQCRDWRSIGVSPVQIDAAARPHRRDAYAMFAQTHITLADPIAEFCAMPRLA